VISFLLDRLGDSAVLALGGLAIGLAFGALAQHSKFCLRAGVIEFADGALGPRVAVWALAFSTAVAATQGALLAGWLDVSEARQLSATGSISGAIVGGLLFGCGMILARGCASRLLVLSATGNLRALVSGMILTVVSQASLRGVLSPLREWLGGLWTVQGGPGRNLLAQLHAGSRTGLLLGLVWLAIGVWLARRNGVRRSEAVAGVGVGMTVAAGWVLTYALSQVTFEQGRITSVSFTGPSADTLMGLINSRTVPLGFDIGLVPGVFLGSMAAALLAREFKWQGFEGGSSMLRYIAGASLMGFGGMLAGGCAVGAGVTGSAIFAITGWLALIAMWGAATLTHHFVDAPAIAKVERAAGKQPA
jgi:uncharacterized protein